MYFVKTPWWLKQLYPAGIWDIPGKEKVLYLTFDDGPHPTATPFVLDELKKYNAKATFFCIGKNVVEYPDIYRRILFEEHKVGNHTYNHLNGWKVSDETYIQDITKAASVIDSKLFRPPYGRITKFQAKLLTDRDGGRNPLYRILMWNILSADFDTEISPEKCASNVIRNAGNGSIVVFHDSEKAFSRLKYALPETLKFFAGKGFEFRGINV